MLVSPIRGLTSGVFLRIITLCNLLNFPMDKDIDVVAQALVPNLYENNDSSESGSRVLKSGECITYEDVDFIVHDISAGLRVVIASPSDVRPGHERNVSAFQSGYMMPLTSPFTEPFIDPLVEHLKETDSATVFWSTFGRGTEDPNERLAHVTAEDIRRETARCLHLIFERSGLNKNPEKRFVCGHSLGGQMSLSMLGNAQDYGFRSDTFDGAIAYNPIPVPYSQTILKGNEGINTKLWTGPVRQGAWPVVKSVMTGDGVKFSRKTAKKFFFEGRDHIGEEAILDRTFKDSAVYFLETLAFNSSKRATEDLRGKKVGIVTCADDPIATVPGAGLTANHFASRGAESTIVPLAGGHFSAFYLPSDGDTDRIRKNLFSAHSNLFNVVFSEQKL